ncbi:MAG TPA: exopolysaccharide biosynthesis protein [Oligoflexus sp.]|uniref:exopolysaccharide biosynthesis protein n=1 Tax=Oligoflexus sp. TaxID=1971216 RepID=UPI002D803E1B|nr:exopolysaccharide biosynthesis protein [Oligoflexus sp.]HET9240014.1 exopolysaccharide biosynthesis protein [Oligoflexus sp.]
MEQSKSRGPLLDHLDEIEARCLQGDPRLKDIIDIFGADGHYVLILFFILPFLQPIPLFGLSTPFGLVIAAIAVLSYLQKPAFIPERWAERKLSAATVKRIAVGSERIFEKIGFLLHPRMKYMLQGPFKLLNAILLVFNAVLLALPLPIPFSNTLPAWMIMFQTLAHLEEDGVFAILSYVQTLICLIYFSLIWFGLGTGIEFLDKQKLF